MTGMPLDVMTGAVEAIHSGTAIYTAAAEIGRLLDDLDWPRSGKSLLDPGAGNGGMLVAALDRLDLDPDDEDAACRAVHGYEFHPDAAMEARNAVARCLMLKGWSHDASELTAERIVEIRDFLLCPVPEGQWDVIAVNPPYWRYANLPHAYRAEYDAKVAGHAKADLMYAYLQRSVDIVARDGAIGVITADRWLLNSGSAELRRRIGRTHCVRTIRRLESHSAFYRPKTRSKGTPARVHPVAMVLSPHRDGRNLDERRFPIDDVPEVEGVPLGDVANILLAPWLGPSGIFTVRDGTGLPEEMLVPCYEPDDYASDGECRNVLRWVIDTGDEEPPETVLRHLDANLERMPARGRRRIRWLPPERLGDRLPLKEDGILMPRISRTIRPLRLPAGATAMNHNIVISSSIPAERLMAILSDHRVRAQADAMALRLEDGYRSYTVTLMRKVVIPEDLLRR